VFTGLGFEPYKRDSEIQAWLNDHIAKYNNTEEAMLHDHMYMGTADALLGLDADTTNRVLNNDITTDIQNKINEIKNIADKHVTVSDTAEMVADTATIATPDEPANRAGGTSWSEVNKQLQTDTKVTSQGFTGEFGYAAGGQVQVADFWDDYKRLAVGGQPVEDPSQIQPAQIPTDPTGTVTGPMGFVDKPPSQVPLPQETADNRSSSLPEQAFVLNAEAVKLRGEKDVKSMLMNAFHEAKGRNLPIGKVDTPLYEKNVDVLLSKGEVVIPPELVQIIGGR